MVPIQYRWLAMSIKAKEPVTAAERMRYHRKRRRADAAGGLPSSALGECARSTAGYGLARAESSRWNDDFCDPTFAWSSRPGKREPQHPSG